MNPQLGLLWALIPRTQYQRVPSWTQKHPRHSLLKSFFPWFTLGETGVWIVATEILFTPVGAILIYATEISTEIKKTTGFIYLSWFIARRILSCFRKNSGFYINLKLDGKVLELCYLIRRKMNLYAYFAAEPIAPHTHILQFAFVRSIDYIRFQYLRGHLQHYLNFVSLFLFLIYKDLVISLNARTWNRNFATETLI